MPTSSIGGYVQDGVKTPNITLTSATWVGTGDPVVGQPVYFVIDSAEEVDVASVAAKLARFAGLVQSFSGDSVILATADNVGDATVNVSETVAAGDLVYGNITVATMSLTGTAASTTNAVARILTARTGAGTTNCTLLTQTKVTA